jgi:hypothetical protein
MDRPDSFAHVWLRGRCCCMQVKEGLVKSLDDPRAAQIIIKVRPATQCVLGSANLLLGPWAELPVCQCHCVCQTCSSNAVTALLELEWQIATSLGL